MHGARRLDNLTEHIGEAPPLVTIAGSTGGMAGAMTLLARLYPLSGTLGGDGILSFTEEAEPHPLRGTPPSPTLALLEVVRHEDAQILREALARLDKGHPIRGLVLRLSSPAEPQGVFVLHAEPGLRGEPATGLLEDRTAIRHREAQMARLASVAQRTSNQVMLCDPNWRIDWVNPAFEQRNGFPLTQARGQRPSTLLRASVTPEIAALERSTLATGKPLRYELEVTTRTGEAYWIEVLVERLTDENGHPLGFSLILVDISERREQMQRMETLERDTHRARRQLREALEALPFGFVLYDQEDRLVLYNAIYRQIYTLSGDSIREGAHYLDILRYGLAHGQYPEAVGREEAWLEERRKDHLSNRSDVEQRMPGDKWLRILETVTPEGGRVGLRIDITALKQAEIALQDSRDRLDAILFAAPNGIMTVDQDQTIRDFNQGAEAMFGYPRADVVGRPLSMLLPEEHRAAHGALAQGFLTMEVGAKRHMFSGRAVSALHAEGHTFPLVVSLSLAEIGGERLVVAVLSEMTAQEQQRLELEKKTRQIADQLVAVEEANRAKSRFLAAMSHELRTPLNAIIGFSDFLASHGDDKAVAPRRVEYLNDIRSAGLHLLSLINDLLDLARIEDRGASLDPTPQHPARLLDDPVRLMRPILQKKKHHIDTRIQADLPQVLADPRGVSQILINLLSNATKFTEPGGRISLSARAEPNGVRIEVEDEGCGIPDDTLPRLGRPFEQAGSHWSGSSSGLGLGLAISRQLAEEMGGHLTIESQEGAWTRVGFTLPLAPALVSLPTPRS